jgi:hypothetical protein
LGDYVYALPLKARIASENSNDFENTYNAVGAVVVIDCTAIVSTPSVVFKLQGKDTGSGKYYDIITSAAITAAGTTVLRIYPGLTAAANLTVSDVLPRAWRINAVNGDADSITYSVGIHLIG